MKKLPNGTVLNAAVEVALRDGFANLTRENVAVHANVSTGSVSLAYGTMCKLKRAVMRYAIKNELYALIATGIAINDKTALRAPEDIKRKALETLL